MAALKHLWWVGASVLATLVACVLAGENGGNSTGAAALLSALHGDALTAQPISVVLHFSQQFYSVPGRLSHVQTVKPVGPNLFAGIDTFDAPVTTTSDPFSLEIGRARGRILLYDSQEFRGWENLWTLTFNDKSGFPANSSINVQGFQELSPAPYNYSVVGGTGAFACAKGVVTEYVAFLNSTLETVRDIANITVGCGFQPGKAIHLFCF